MTEDSEGFLGKLTNVKMLQSIFKAICLNDESCFYIKKDGLKMTVEDAKTFQANAFIQSSMFNEFNIGEEDDFGFNISLSTLLECLSIFGSANLANATSTNGIIGSTLSLASAQTVLSGSAITSLVLHYGKYGDPLSMWMEEDGVVSKAEIPTQDVKETLFFDFSKPNVIAKVVMLSEHLKDLFAEFDMSSDTLEIGVDDDAKTVSFSTNGNAGEVTISLPEHSEIVHIFECRRKSKAKYPMNLLKNALKAIVMSQKLSLRMDQQNILCMQYMISYPEGNCFLEFYCAPEIECEA